MASLHADGDRALPLAVDVALVTAKSDRRWSNQNSNNDFDIEAQFSNQEEAQLEMAVEDDGIAEGGEDADIADARGVVDDDDDDDDDDDGGDYLFVASGGAGGLHSLEDGSGLIACKAVGVEMIKSDTGQTDQASLNVGDGEASGDVPACSSTPENAAPLGSSQNPIRIIQQGNKYTSMQQLSPEQLQQIMQVIQQQQMMQSSKSSSVLFNPETQTKIIYRIVYPSDIHSTGGRKKSRRSLEDSDSETSGRDREMKKKKRARTRSGRVCRPPQYMVKDYKHIHPVDYDVAEEASNGGYSDFKESSEDEDGEDCVVLDDTHSKLSEDSSSQAAGSKRKSFKCATCEKSYIGHGGLARHYRLQPTHGKLDDLPTDALGYANSNDSFQSSSVGSSTPSGAAAVQQNAATSFAGTITTCTRTDTSPLGSTKSSAADKEDSACGAELVADLSGAVGAVSASAAKMPHETPHVAPKRRRGRPPASSQIQAERRKDKLRELILQCSSEELMEVVLPRLAPSISLWQYLALRSDAISQNTAKPESVTTVTSRPNGNHVDVAFVLDEYATLHQKVRHMCDEQLVPGDTEKAESCGSVAEDRLKCGAEDGVSVGVAEPAENKMPETEETSSTLDPTTGTDALAVANGDGISGVVGVPDTLQSMDDDITMRTVPAVPSTTSSETSLPDQLKDTEGRLVESMDVLDEMECSKIPSDISVEAGGVLTDTVTNSPGTLDAREMSASVTEADREMEKQTSAGEVVALATGERSSDGVLRTFEASGAVIPVSTGQETSVDLMDAVSSGIVRSPSCGLSVGDLTTIATVTEASDRTSVQPVADVEALLQPVANVVEASLQPVADDEASLQPVTDVEASLQLVTDDEASLRPLADDEASSGSLQPVADDECLQPVVNGATASLQPLAEASDPAGLQPVADADAAASLEPAAVATTVAASAASADQPSELHPWSTSSTDEHVTVDEESAVKTINNLLEISSSELAHCLGLSVGTLYRVKEPTLQPTPQSPTHKQETGLTAEDGAQQDDVAMETAANTSGVSEPHKPTPTTSLPPRKRIRLIQPEIPSVVEPDVPPAVDELAAAEIKPIPPIAFATAGSASSALSMCGLAAKQNGNMMASQLVNGGVAVAQPRCATALRPSRPNVNVRPSAMSTLGSIVSQPRFASRPTASIPKRGRRPKQMMSCLRPNLNTAVMTAAPAPVAAFRPATVPVISSAMSTSSLAGSYMDSVAVAQSSELLQAANVIQIPANAQVIQTEDGMIIVCHPDGTLQIHGHREGQTIPLDTIRAVLGLDSTQLVAMNESDDVNAQNATDGNICMTSENPNAMEIPVETQALFDIATSGQQIVALDGSQAAYLSVDGGQQLLSIDGVPAIMAYDPVTGQTVAFDPSTGQQLAIDLSGQALAFDPSTGEPLAIDPTSGQALVSLDPTLMTGGIGQTTLVAVDGNGRPMVTMDQFIAATTAGQTL